MAVDASHREAIALLGCVAIGLAAIGSLVLLDRSAVNPDALLWTVFLMAAVAVVALGFAAKVARTRFFVLGILLAETTAYGVWWIVVLSNLRGA